MSQLRINLTKSITVNDHKINGGQHRNMFWQACYTNKRDADPITVLDAFLMLKLMVQGEADVPAKKKPKGSASH